MSAMSDLDVQVNHSEVPAALMDRQVWHRQYSDVHGLLAEYVLTDTDGWKGVAPDAPKGLTDAYGMLQRVGYAKGWL